MNKKGFTLIELMIVIAIIGILAAIAIPNFTAMRDKAAVKGALSSCQGLQKGIENYISIDGESLGNGDIYADLKTAIGESGSEYFQFSQLEGNLRKIYVWANGSTGYSIVGEAKDSDNTVVSVSAWDRTGTTNASAPGSWSIDTTAGDSF